MAVRIKCPYCFGKFNDNEVHFRVPVVKDPDTSELPDWCDSIEDLMNSPRLTDERKTEIADLYQKKNFYAPQTDEIYSKFWSCYNGGTTEKGYVHQKYPPYSKRVIVPLRDQQYLKLLNKERPDLLDSYFRHEQVGNDKEQTFASEIELFDGTVCSERVCPKCHNPLPGKYGAYPVKFISIVGATASGKTVYLSQFFKYFRMLIYEVGYTGIPTSPALTNYIINNEIAVNEALPASTRPDYFQQPVIIELTNEKDKEKYTFVFNDVGGEYFSGYFTDAEINKYAGFIGNSDAIIMMMDPGQFEDLSKEEKSLYSPNPTIDSLHQVLGLKLCSIPCAVCISKCDRIYDIMNHECVTALKSDYKGISRKDRPNLRQPVLNAEQINSYEEYLSVFVHKNNIVLDSMLAVNFEDYSYFAVSALGCPVDEKTFAPTGPISPKRIMDPFYWIMYKLGLIEASDGIYNPNGPVCLNPDCKKHTTNKLKEPYTVELGLFHKKKHVFTHYCSGCHCYFNPDNDDYILDEQK